MAAALIEDGVRIEGLVEARHDLIVEGRIEGRIVAGGRVTIASAASCRSSVRSPRLEVQGELIGSAVCTELIEVAPGARVVGDLRAPDVHIGAGAEVDGRVDLLAPEPSSHTAQRQVVSARGLGPIRPVPPDPSSQTAEFARRIPRPPRPSGKIRVSARGDDR